jgi:hypothetical protein
VLGTKADGNAERIAILLRFRFGVQVAQVERADVHQLQFLATREQNAALLFEQVDHRREIVAAAVIDAPWFGRRGNPLWLPWVDTGVYPYGIFKLRDGRLRRVFDGWHRYGFYGEGAGDAHHAAHDPGAVVEHLLGRVALDAGIDLMPLLALELPEAAQSVFRCIRPVLRRHRIGHLAQVLPAVTGQPIDCLQERFRLLLGAQLARPLELKKVPVRLPCLLGPDGMRHLPRYLPFQELICLHDLPAGQGHRLGVGSREIHNLPGPATFCDADSNGLALERRIELCQRLLDLRLVSGGDGVNFGVLRDGLQRDVRHGLVFEAAGGTAFGVFEFVVVELCSHQPLAGDGERYAAGIAGDPAPPPLLGAVGGGAGAAGGVEDQVARVGGHQNAALDDFGVGLDGVEFLCFPPRIAPNVCQLNATTATKFSRPNTSSSRQRTRCRFSSLICTKMEPLSLRSSRHKSRRSRR